MHSTWVPGSEIPRRLQGRRPRVCWFPSLPVLRTRVERSLWRGALRSSELQATTVSLPPQALPEKRQEPAWKRKRLDFAPLSSIFCLMSPGPIVGEESTSPRP